MRRRVALGVWVALVAVGCGGAARNAELVHQPTAHEPLEIAAPAQAAPDPGAHERAAQDCNKACRLVNGCLPEVTVEQCMERCQQSRWATSNGTRCLALRVLWIDEEGCPRIGPTWQLFDDDDDCSGPPPDER